MAHLKGFGLENFRVFKEYTWFDFAPITILVGPNNSGKSSLIKALLLLKENKNNLDNLSFNKGGHGLISFSRVIHNSENDPSKSDDIITFKIPINIEDSDLLVLKYQYLARSTSPKLIDSDTIDESGNSFNEGVKEILKKDHNKDKYPGPSENLDFTQKIYGINFLSYLNHMSYLPMVKNKNHVEAAESNTSEYYTRGLKFFKIWSEKFGLVIGQTPLNEQTNERHVIVNGRTLNEVGTGIQQIISLLFFIAEDLPLAYEEMDEKKKHGYILILEEPEANLHPKFQSMLADMLVEAQRSYKIQFIVETHSEYLIRKLQYLTAKGDLKPKDVVIQYFHDPNNIHIPTGEKQVKKINILEDGSLSDDFGTGFYDEAAHWKFELLRLKNTRKN